MKLVLKHTFFVIGLFLFSFTSAAQQAKIDSLKTLLEKETNDLSRITLLLQLSDLTSGDDATLSLNYALQAEKLSIKIKDPTSLSGSIRALGWAYYSLNNYGPALKNYFMALEISEKLDDQQSIALICGNIGSVYNEQAEYEKALTYFSRALSLNTKLQNKGEIATNLGNIGLVYDNKGDYPNALDYYFKALRADEALGNKTGIARHTGNIGNIYDAQGNSEKALEYYSKALKLDEELGNKRGIARHLGNIGIVYNGLKDYPKELDYFFRALKIDEELNNQGGVSRHYGNIGNVYIELADEVLNNKKEEHNKKQKADSLYDQAAVYFFKALKINEETDNKSSVAACLGNIGSLYYSREKNSLAEEYFLKALSLSRQIGALDYVSAFEESISELYTKENNWPKAYEHYKKFIAIKDSIFNEDNTRKTVQTQMQYEFDKKELSVKATQDKKDAIEKEENQKQNVIIYSISSGFVLVLLLAIFIFRSYRQKQRANIKILKQKAIIEEKQKEILDSIQYAKRIQQSLMPTEKHIDKILNRQIKP